MIKSQKCSKLIELFLFLYVVSINKVYFLSIVNRTIFFFASIFVLLLFVCLPLLFRVHFSLVFSSVFFFVHYYSNIIIFKITLETNLNRHHHHRRLRIFSVYAFGAFAF